MASTGVSPMPAETQQHRIGAVVEHEVASWRGDLEAVAAPQVVVQIGLTSPCDSRFTLIR